MQMITPKDIEKKTMTEAKRAEAKNSFVAFYLGRPLTYILTVPFLYTSITPNTVTIVSIIFVIASFVCFTVATTSSMRLLGLFLLFLWAVFDGIDGNIARYKNLKSTSGDLLDTLGGYLAIVVVFLGMGNMAYHDSLSSVYISKEFIIEIAGLSTALSLIPRLLMHRQIALHNNSNADILKDKSNYSIAKIIALNICDPAGAQVIIILLAILFHLESEFTIGYFGLNLAIMVYSLQTMIKNSGNSKL